MMENFFDVNRERLYDPLYRLFNYATGKYEDLDDIPDDLSPYIPQHKKAQLMYLCMIGLGETPINAMVKVMESLVGKE